MSFEISFDICALIFNLMIIIGVVGQIASGKGVLVKYLVKKFNFTSFSLSSIVHDELEKRNTTKFTRETMQEVGNKLRCEYGGDILARRAIDRLKKQKNERIIIEGIRNPSEIEFLKKNSKIILIGIKTKKELRFKRLLLRAKPWDPKNWEDFVKVDKNDFGIGQNNSGQQVGKCLKYCDYILTNNRDKQDFERKTEELMKVIFKAST